MSKNACKSATINLLKNTPVTPIRPPPVLACCLKATHHRPGPWPPGASSTTHALPCPAWLSPCSRPAALLQGCTAPTSPSSIWMLFSLFEQTGSALAVVKHFAKHRLLFPNRLWGKTREGELLWKPLRHGRVLDVLHNPRYAGVYVYGRTQTRTRALPHEPPRIKGRTRRVAVADWPIVRYNAHP